jgi:hypothetical protein
MSKDPFQILIIQTKYLSATKGVHLTISIKRHLRENELSTAANDHGSSHAQICEAQHIPA